MLEKFLFKVAKALAHSEYDKYRKEQDKLYNSDFDLYLENLYNKKTSN